MLVLVYLVVECHKVQGLENEVVILVWVYSPTSYHKGWDPKSSLRVTQVVGVGQEIVIVSQRSCK